MPYSTFFFKNFPSHPSPLLFWPFFDFYYSFWFFSISIDFFPPSFHPIIFPSPPPSQSEPYSKISAHFPSFSVLILTFSAFSDPCAFTLSVIFLRIFRPFSSYFPSLFCPHYLQTLNLKSTQKFPSFSAISYIFSVPFPLILHSNSQRQIYT